MKTTIITPVNPLASTRNSTLPFLYSYIKPTTKQSRISSTFFITSDPSFFQMSNNENSPPPTPTATSNRRASFSPGQKLSELFGRSPPNGNGTSAYPTPIATAAANAQAQQRRRTSIASLGMAGSPTQTSAFTNMRNRQSSFGSGSSPSTSINENAVEEADAEPNMSPTSPFARRMSFGAKALRDVRAGVSGNANGRTSTNASCAPSVQGRDVSSSRGITVKSWVPLADLCSRSV